MSRGSSTRLWGSMEDASGVRLVPDDAYAPGTVTARMPSMPLPAPPPLPATTPRAPAYRSGAVPVAQAVQAISYPPPSPGVDAIMMAVARAVVSRTESEATSAHLGRTVIAVVATALVAVLATLVWTSTHGVAVAPVHAAPTAAQAPAAATPVTIAEPEVVPVVPALPPAPAPPPPSVAVRARVVAPLVPVVAAKPVATTPPPAPAPAPAPVAPAKNEDAVRAAELLKKQLANTVE